MMLYIGADHRGFELKAAINRWMDGRGIEFRDMGAYEYDHDDDYVDVAVKVAEEVGKDRGRHRGILICGSGVGVSVAANKVRGVRCGLGFAVDQVHAARKEDDINVLAIPADNVDQVHVLAMVERFLETEFVETDRYLRRREKIVRLEGLLSD